MSSCLVLPTDGARRRPLILIVGLLLSAGCHGGDEAKESVATYLERDWDRYQNQYVRTAGYVVDPARNGGRVTSEGQAYALLRTALLGRERSFRRIFRWTENHLRRQDGLYSWLWSPQDSVVLDYNTAADADQEIALALLIAAHRFKREEYRSRASRLLRNIRRHESIKLDKGWFPAAGNWAVDDRIVNLSYFLPYAYPYFHRVDPDGNWKQALSAGYRLLTRLLSRPKSQLPPDFLVVGSDGRVTPVSDVDSSLSGNYSFDAMRIHWRVAVDCLLHDRPRACADPSQADFFVRELAEEGRVVTRYSTAGDPLAEQESLSFYGSLLPAFRLHHPPVYRAVRQSIFSEERLQRLSAKTDRYYDRNWVWFGLAAASGWLRDRMPPLSKSG